MSDPDEPSTERRGRAAHPRRSASIRPCARPAGSRRPTSPGTRSCARSARARSSTTAGLARVVHHGGIWLDAHPVALDAPPATVRAGVHVAVYALGYEPEPVPLPDDSSCTTPRAWSRRTSPPGCRCRARARASGSRSRSSCARGSTARRCAPRTGSTARRAASSCSRATPSARRSSARRCRIGGSSARYLAVVSPPPKEDTWTVRGRSAPRRRRRASASSCAPRPRATRAPSETEFSVAAPRRRARARRVPPADGAHAPAARAPRRGRDADLRRRPLRPAVPAGRADERAARAAPRRAPAREAGRRADPRWSSRRRCPRTSRPSAHEERVQLVPVEVAEVAGVEPSAAVARRAFVLAAELDGLLVDLVDLLPVLGQRARPSRRCPPSRACRRRA